MPDVNFLANTAPPLYQAYIPNGQEWFFETAGPIFLALAVIMLGWWLLRFRTVQTTPSRVLLLAGVGILALSYTAFWIWFHRDEMEGHYCIGRGVDGLCGTVAADMPLVFICYCLFVTFFQEPGTEDRDNLWNMPWRLRLLVRFLAFGTVIVMLPTCFAYYRPLPVVFFELLGLCSIAVLLVWGVAGGIVTVLFFIFNDEQFAK